MPSPAMAETQDTLGSLKQHAMSAVRGLWLTDELLILKPPSFYFTPLCWLIKLSFWAKE